MQQGYSTPVESIKTGLRPNILGWVIGIVLVLIIVGAVYFTAEPKQAELPTFPAESVITEPEKLSTALIFASYIDDDFVYEVQPNAEYTVGDPVFIYIGLTNFMQEEDLSVNIAEDIEVLDASGKSVLSKIDFAVLNTAYVEQINYVRFKNIIPTADLSPGRYTVKIKLKDNYARETITETSEFTLIEKSAEVTENTLDLTGLVSDSGAQLVIEQTVWDPDGNVIEELSYSQQVTGDLSDIDLSNIDASMKIPDRFDAGVYTAEIKYTNTATGEFVAVKDTVEVIKELIIDELVFADTISSDYSYVVQPNAVYSVGNGVYVYMKLVDFAQPMIDGEYSVKFEQDIYVFDENNNEILSQTNYIEIDDLNEQKQDNYKIKNSFRPGGSVGKYTFRAVIRDLNGNHETTREGNFWLE